MFVQRKVNTILGRNNTRNHELIYSEIEKRIGAYKICNFGHLKGSKTGVKHEGEKQVPIRCFELKGVTISETNQLTIKAGDGLQGFCRDCSKRRRRVRLTQAREANEGGYDTYVSKYGKETYECSVCKEEKDVRLNFGLSPGMECGIHNVCKSCSKKYGESMGDRSIKYRPDGNFKYNKAALTDMHDDHIFPLAYGGTNEEINHQLLSSTENLSKGSTIPFTDITTISPLLLCERWRNILIQSQVEKIPITILKGRLSTAILNEQLYLNSQSDENLTVYFSDYNQKWNYRKNVIRCVEKFRLFANTLTR